MANNELNQLPCPHCGGAAKLFGGYNGGAAAINCTVCDAYGPSVLGKEAAIEAWNRRATPAHAEPSDALPELPSSFAQIPRLDGTLCDAYTPNQMRAYAKQAIEARILGQQGGGDAARLKEAWREGWGQGMQEAQELLASEIADAALLDWLETMTVNVRVSLRYGSRDLFWASPSDDDGDIGPSDIRAQITAAIQAQAGEGGA